MAAKKIPGVYLETMESSKGTNYKPQEIGYSKILRPQMGICERLLECGWKSDSPTLNNRQTPRTGRILQHPCPIRGVALMRLNRRIGNPTSGGVGGRDESPSYPIVIDDIFSTLFQ